MLCLLSPSKTLDLEPLKKSVKTSEPALIEETKKLIPILKKKNTKQLMSLMEISEKLATLNVERYKAFRYPFPTDEAKPALFMFKGDVYEPIEPASYSAKQLQFANEHIRILSGLYGLLRPLDNMFPYRLEMGIKLKNPRGEDLYDFWGDRITDEINQQSTKIKAEAILNLASEEYFSAVNAKKLKTPLINIIFKEWKGDGYKTIALFAKKARGGMVDYIVKNGLTRIKDLPSISFDGYRFDKKLSSEQNYVYTRRK